MFERHLASVLRYQMLFYFQQIYNPENMIKQLILPLLLLPYCAIAAHHFQDIIFQEGNLPAAQERAAREGKLYFVHFTATWCMPCQWMEQNTFTDPALSDYVNAHYLAVKMDFDSKEAEKYKKLYNVVSLPSMLIFNTKGDLIDRHDASLDATALLKILYDHNKSDNRSTLTTHQAQPSSAAVVKVTYNSEKISRPALIPDNNPDPIYYEPPVANPQPPTTKPDISAPRASGNYAIQVGVYSEFANAQKSQVRMEQRFEQVGRIQQMHQNGKTLYRVMIGAFETKAAAEKYLLYLESQSVRGFVKNMDN